MGNMGQSMNMGNPMMTLPMGSMGGMGMPPQTMGMSMGGGMPPQSMMGGMPPQSMGMMPPQTMMPGSMMGGPQMGGGAPFGPGSGQYMPNVSRPGMTAVANPPIMNNNVQYGPSYKMQYAKRS